jgi:outer membrane protein
MQVRIRRISPWVAVAALAVAVVLVGVLAWRAGPALSQSFTIGVVDMQRALDAHPRKASSERALQEFFQAKQREFQARARALTPLQRQELDRQMQQEFLHKRQELLGGLDRDIRAAVEKVSRERGVSVVLDRSVVLYGGVDLTDAVIAALTAK